MLPRVSHGFLGSSEPWKGGDDEQSFSAIFHRAERIEDSQ